MVAIEEAVSVSLPKINHDATYRHVPMWKKRSFERRGALGGKSD